MLLALAGCSGSSDDDDVQDGGVDTGDLGAGGTPIATGGTVAAPDDSDDDDDEGVDEDAEDPDQPGDAECDDAMEATEGILTDYCANCHGGVDEPRGNFNAVLDVETLIDTGKVVPYEPDESDLYVKIESEAMPLSADPDRLAIPVSSGEKETVRTWIVCGAPAWEPPAPPDVDEDACIEAPLAAKAVLDQECNSCHNEAAAPGSGGAIVLDSVPSMLDQEASGGPVLAQDGNPESSRVWLSLWQNGDNMPQGPDSSVQIDDPDLEALELWLTCGGQDWDEVEGAQGETFAFTSIDDRLELILDDLEDIDSEADRLETRYIDLSNLANSGMDSNEIQVYREAVIFLMNSLSLGQRPVVPEAIDDEELIYRIELEDFEWDADKWSLLENEYPYAVIYDEDGEVFDFNEDDAEEIREETGSDIPYIQADWFISHASQTPLYHFFLELPNTLQQVEEQVLGIDVLENIEDEDVVRIGFSVAGPSQNHRVIERHELDGGLGAFWISYDFANNLDDANIFADPLAFAEDGGEMIFNLPNGLQGYYLAAVDADLDGVEDDVDDRDGNGVADGIPDLTRLDFAPNAVVQDPSSITGEIQNGLACFTCHQLDGIIERNDEIREFIRRTNVDIRDEVLAIYPSQDEINDVYDEDNDRYDDARARMGLQNLNSITFHNLNDAHEVGRLDLEDLASVLGIEADELAVAIDADQDAFPAAVANLRQEGGAIARDELDNVFGDIVLGLDLGDQLLVDVVVEDIVEDNVRGGFNRVGIPNED